MALTTGNMGLTQPDLSEAANITVLNNNFGLIDAHTHESGKGLPIKRLQSGTGDPPSASNAGDVYVQTGGANKFFFHNGTAWQELAVVGSPIGLTKIGEAVLGAPAASITFTNIPATYHHLLVVLQARGDLAGSQSVLALARFNGDTTGNYDAESLNAAGSTPSTSEWLAATSGLLGSLPAASAPASTSGQIDVLIANYAGTVLKKSWRAMAVWSRDTASGGIALNIVSGQWRNTGAITTLSLFPQSGNFVAGSSGTLYGLPK